ncbi:hypothetical protein PM082_017040 [Marasmius tenuissimus]|nr:hypothetical protein PM082_017040 [Marasmius tenuissimus]
MAPSTDGLRAGATVLHVIALVFTTYRLVHRARIQRFSWDDGFALMGFLLGALELLCLWLIVVMDNKYPFGSPSFNNVQSGLFWFVSISFTFLVSFTRISLWLSIRRILAPSKLRSTYAALIVGTFVSAVVLVTVKASMCKYSAAPRVRDYPLICNRPAGKIIGVFQSIIDIALSFLLIVMPIYALRNMDLPRAKRNLLIFVFTGSIGTLVAALFHNAIVLRVDARLNFFTTHYEAAVALIVCNIHVVIPRIYIKLSHRNGNGDITTSASASTTGQPARTGIGPSDNAVTLTTLTDVTHPEADSTCGGITSSVFGGGPSTQGTETHSTPRHTARTTDRCVITSLVSSPAAYKRIPSSSRSEPSVGGSHILPPGLDRVVGLSPDSSPAAVIFSFACLIPMG